MSTSKVREKKFRINVTKTGMSSGDANAGDADADAVELYQVDESTQDTFNMSLADEPNAEPDLVETSDGRIVIEMKPSKTCQICKKVYPTVKSLKEHQLRCTGGIKEYKETLHKEKVAAMVAQPGEEFFKYCNPNPENPCYCCGEEESTAHVGHIKCKVCPKSFKAYEYLEKHLASVHAETKEFACKQCNARCSSSKILEAHMLTHDEGKPFSCNQCGKDFTRKYHLDRHRNHSACGDAPKQMLPCEVCGKEFTRIDNLREHLRFHMGEAERKRDYPCPYCDKSFYGSSLLNIHIRTHTGEKPFPCDLCTKSFPSTGALRKHRRSHTGERPYRCDHCSATFAARETLNRHRKTHTGEKPHECTDCGKRFIQATQLRSHQFQHTGEGGFPCSVCDQTFSRKCRRDEHIRFEHLKEQPLACDFCQKSFFRREDLHRHVAIHTDEKNYFCEVCDKRFTTRTSLKTHSKTHTLNPVICGLCKQSFLRHDLFIRHMRAKHRDEELLVNPVEKPIPEVAEDQVSVASVATERTDEVLEFEGEIYEITPVDDIEIVQLSSETVSMQKRHRSELKTVDVVEIVSSEIEPRHRQREEAKKVSPQKQQSLAQTSAVFRKPEAISIVKKTVAPKKPVATKPSTVSIPPTIHVKLPSTINQAPYPPKPVTKPLPTKPIAKPLPEKPIEKSPPNKPVGTKSVPTEKLPIPVPAAKSSIKPASKSLPIESNAKPPPIKPASKPVQTKPVPRSIPTKPVENPLPPKSLIQEEQSLIVPLPGPSETQSEIQIFQPKAKRKRSSNNTNSSPPASKIKLEEADDGMPIFLTDSMLKQKVGELLQVLIDEEMLADFGWPNAPIEQLLSNVLERCGHKPVVDAETGDSTTRLRENTKLLFSLTMDDDHVKMLLNNQTVDEVIMNVLKSK